MDDYRGGMLNGMGKQDKIDRDSFIESLSDTAVITFLIDGTTVLNAMDEETFELFLQYQLRNCERPELLGASSHTVDILRKY